MRIRNKYIIELDYEYDHESLLELYNRHECTPYKHQVTGKELGFSHCYTEYLFNEPVVQKIIADFSYLDLRFEFGEHCKSTGFTLCESRMAPDLTITPHIDYARSACLTFPLTFPQVVQFYDGDDVVYEYQYQHQTAVLGNIGSIKHGVTYAPDIRRQFQLDIFNTWDEISEIISNKALDKYNL